MAAVVKKIKWLYGEFGFGSVVDTGKDAWIIILQRSLRMFAYGTNSLILALFFASLEFSDYQIGLFMTLTLAGDVVLGTILTLIADQVGRRRVLLAGSCLMVLSGTVFAIFENFWILLFAAVVGVISATGGDFGPFRSIEESMISGLTESVQRSDVLSWYVTFSSVGSALGSEVSGRMVHYLTGRDGWDTKGAYHVMFYMYTIMGLCNFLLVLCLSQKCELEHSPVPSQVPQGNDEAEMMLLSDSEDDTLFVHEEHDDVLQANAKHFSGTSSLTNTTQKSSKFRAVLSFFSSRLAQISPPTRYVMYKLWFLLCIDSVADGMVPYTLTNYYIDKKFQLPKSTLGDVTSVAYILASISTIFAAPLARRIGLVNTMVFTHVPSSTAVLLFPVGNSVILTIGLFLVRAGLNNMDQAPRSALIAAVVRPEERTAVMGITSMIRTLASTAGPTITGILAGNDRFWIAFVVAGICRLGYDFGLWAMFINLHIDQHEKPPATKGNAVSRLSDEEEGESTEMQKI